MTTETIPIAVRGDHLVLFEIRQRDKGDFEVNLNSVVEVDESGVATYLGVWDEDDLQLAVDELNRRWLETIDEAQKATAVFAIEAGDAVVHADLDWLDAHLAPGFESNDHRPAGFGDRDRATFMAMVAQRPTTVGDGVMILTEVLRCDPEWIVASMNGRTSPPGGGGYISEQSVVAMQFDGNQILRSDIYPLELPDQALAAAEEGTREQKPVATSQPLGNIATRIGAQLAETGYERRDWPAVEALLDEDLLFEVRRRVAVPGGGKTELVEALRAWPDTGISHHVEPIAVRGDSLALFEQRSLSDNGDEVRICFLVEVSPDGLIRSVISWDHDDLELANEELDALRSRQ